MRVLFSRLIGKARITVPKEVRRVLGVKPGDAIVYRSQGKSDARPRAQPLDRAYLSAVESTLSASADDSTAYDNL